MTFSAIIAAVILMASADVASEPATHTAMCASYVGRRVQAVTVHQAIPKVELLARNRGEYETSADYQKWREDAARRAPAELIIKVPLDWKYISYDADTSSFAISGFALDNRNAAVEAALLTLDDPDPKYRPASDKIDVIVYHNELVEGSYRATNAYGASVVVKRILRTSTGVYERPALESEQLFRTPMERFAARSDLTRSGPIAYVSASPAEAPRMRNVLSAAIVVRPWAPFYAFGTKHWGPARIDKPFVVTENVSLVLGDIRCALIMDGQANVLVSIATQ